MRLRDLLNQGRSLAGREPGEEFDDLFKVALNLIYYELLDEAQTGYETREFLFTSVSGTRQYGMPLDVERIISIEDPTNVRDLTPIAQRAYDSAYPGHADSGSPTKFYQVGYFGVQAQPASAGTLTLVSSSIADDGADFKVMLYGRNSSGVQTREEITMDGTTNVTSSTSWNTTNGIERVVLLAAEGKSFAGNITISDIGANTLAVIPPYYGDSPAYQWIELYPQPDAAITYTVRAEMRKRPLIHDADWPELPEASHNLILYGAISTTFHSLGKSTEADRASTLFRQGKKRLKGRQASRGARFRTMEPITSSQVYGGPPHRPLIEGIDI